MIAGYLGYKGAPEPPGEPPEIEGQGNILDKFIDAFVAAGGIKV